MEEVREAVYPFDGNGRRVGTFASLVDTNLPANFTSSLSYDANDAYLNVRLGYTTPSGLNANQQAVANTLTNFLNAAGGIPLVFGRLSPSGLSQASGENATGSQQTTFNAMTQFMNMLTDPFVAGRSDGFGPSGGAPTGYASTQNAGVARDAYGMFSKAPARTWDPRWNVWAAEFGGSQTTDGNAAVGSSSTTSNIASTAVGADYYFSPFTTA
jgi:hypothetical protein